MISVTAVPDQLQAAGLRIGRVAVEYSSGTDLLTVRGVIHAEGSEVQTVRAEIRVEFFGKNGQLMLSRDSTCYGRLSELGFCLFHVDVPNVSSLMDVSKITEIRLSPALG